MSVHISPERPSLASNVPGPSPELLACIEKAQAAIEALGEILGVALDSQIEVTWMVDGYVVRVAINDSYTIYCPTDEMTMGSISLAHIIARFVFQRSIRGDHDPERETDTTLISRTADALKVWS